MKSLLFVIALILSKWSFGQEKKLFKDYFNEFHVSVNHGIPLFPADRTFFGGGLGISHVFCADKIISFRTGLDFQLFHEWDEFGEPAHYSSVKNIHYFFVDLSAPLMMRLNVSRFFVEFGANVGVGVGGRMRSTVSSYTPYQPTTTTEQKSRTGSGFWFGPALGIGTLIPLNEKLDLLVRPDIQLNWNIFEHMNLYGRLCVGIRLK
jgi:hypothetical protein